jgi:hypothetical protein
MAQQWEYAEMVVTPNGPNDWATSEGTAGQFATLVAGEGEGHSFASLVVALTPLGQDGWELAGVISAQRAGGPDRLIFKRPKTGDRHD